MGADPVSLALIGLAINNAVDKPKAPKLQLPAPAPAPTQEERREASAEELRAQRLRELNRRGSQSLRIDPANTVGGVNTSGVTGLKL